MSNNALEQTVSYRSSSVPVEACVLVGSKMQLCPAARLAR